MHTSVYQMCSKFGLYQSTPQRNQCQILLYERRYSLLQPAFHAEPSRVEKMN